MSTKPTPPLKTVISAAAFASMSARRKAARQAAKEATPPAIPENPRTAQLLFAALALLDTAFAATSEPQLKKDRLTGNWIAVAPQAWFGLLPQPEGWIQVRCTPRRRRAVQVEFPLEDLAQLPALEKWVARELRP